MEEKKKFQIKDFNYYSTNGVMLTGFYIECYLFCSYRHTQCY